ncbi:MAG: dihydrolipoamide acetyltransferase family protein, partial [Microbacteriaceae bacterium]
APAPGKVLAKPPVRKLAKDLGINLASVTPTGAHGQVLRDDVLSHASAAPAAAAGAGLAGVSTAPRPAAPQFTTNGEREERVPVKGIRKVVAQAMVESKFSAPHTGVYVDIDATRTMEFVKRLKTSGSFEGVRVSPLLIMAKAVTWALARNPEINSAWADTEIVRRNYVNLGIAAATPRGLVVPNIKDAHLLSLREMAQAIETLTDRARAGLTQPAEMQQGTITITNVGVFGVDFGLPILNPGETAIMAMGSIKEKPWVVDGEVRPRMVTTVGGSFDHRVVDGDVISNFVADVASVLEEPALLLD